MVDYNKRLVEVDEILNYLSEEDLMKIPKEVRNTIKENKDKEYFWEYDKTKPLKEQDVSRDTIAFLSYLNMEYLLNEEQKEFMQQLHELNEKKLEELKVEKYSVDDLFKKKNNMQEVMTDNTDNKLITYKENYLRKIINKIRELFKKY